MSERNERGQFAAGNTQGTKFGTKNAHASAGGKARAAALSSERRREIARMGWRAFVKRYFGEDEQAAKVYAGRLYAWGVDRDDPMPKFFKPELPSPVASD